MAKFADYGFNKSHAAAYALVAYQTAWLKANHPEVFIAACMSLAISNTDRLGGAAPGSDAHGHPHPAAGHQPLRRRFHAWSATRTASSGDPLRAGRGEEGRHRGDAGGGRRARRHGRSPTSPTSPRASIRGSSTACSSRTWCAPAPSMRWSRTAPACSPAPRRSCGARRRPRRKRTAARSACSAPRRRARETLRLPDVPDWPPMERLTFEAEAIGFHLTAHPLDAYATGAAPARRRAVQPGRTAARRPARRA